MSRRVLIACILWVAAACSSTPPRTESLPTQISLDDDGNIIAAQVAEAGEAQLPTLAVLPTAMPQSLNFWQAVSGTLTPTDDAQLWQFTAQQGDAIGLRALGDNLTIMLTLFDANDNILSEGSSIEATLPADGVYFVRVQLTQGDGGEYELGLRYTDRPNPNVIVPTDVPQIVGVPTPTPAYFADLGTFADEIVSGKAQTGTFDETSESFVHTFEGKAGQYAVIFAERTSGSMDPVINLYGPSGNRLAMDDNAGGGSAALLRNIVLPEDGIYTIQVMGNGFRGNYRLQLDLLAQPVAITPTIIAVPTATRRPQIRPTFAPAPSDTILQEYVPAQGNLTRPGLFNRFPFEGEAGEIVSIGVRPAVGSTFLPKIEVVNPLGEIIATATAADSNADGDALLTGLRIDITGSYSIFVTAQDGESTGEYIISYGRGTTYEDVIRGEPIAGRVNNGAVVRRGLRDVWEVVLREGDVISAQARALTGSGLDPVLTLVAPDGELLAIDDNGGGNGAALIAATRVAQNGVYRLEVTAAGSATAGQYTLMWDYVAHGPTPTAIPARVLIMSVDDVVPAEQAYGFYPFQGHAGERVLISVAAQDATELDPVAALLNPDGEVIAEGDDDDALNARFEAELPEDGTYVVRVNGYGTTTGAFVLSVERLIPR